MDTIFTVVKEVKHWRQLAKSLIHAYDQYLDALQRQHGSDEECLKAVIQVFLQGKGGRLDQQPISWRSVIWALYEADEVQLASSIQKSHAESLRGV